MPVSEGDNYRGVSGVKCGIMAVRIKDGLVWDGLIT